MSVITKVFKSNTTQAVRLPRGVAFDEGVTEVEVTVVGNARLITPVGGAKWDFFFATVPPISADFMVDREQPPMQEREWLPS